MILCLNLESQQDPDKAPEETPLEQVLELAALFVADSGRRGVWEGPRDSLGLRPSVARVVSSSSTGRELVIPNHTSPGEGSVSGVDAIPASLVACLPLCAASPSAGGGKGAVALAATLGLVGRGLARGRMATSVIGGSVRIDEDWSELRLRGPSARTFVLSGYLAALPAGVLFLGTIVFVLVNGLSFRASEAPVLFYTLFGIFCASVTAGAILTQMGMRKLLWEIDRGYVTMPYDFRSCDLRDPRDGRILRPAGTPGGASRLSVSLSKWRRMPK